MLLREGRGHRGYGQLVVSFSFFNAESTICWKAASLSSSACETIRPGHNDWTLALTAPGSGMFSDPAFVEDRW